MTHLTEKDLGMSNFVKLDIKYSDLSVLESEIINSMGYHNDEIHEHFRDIIREVIEKAPDLVNIQAGYGIYKTSVNRESKDKISIADIEFNTKRIVVSQLKNSDYAAVFLCSIGPGMEEWIKGLSKLGELEKSYIADTVASTITEETANYLHDYLGKKMKENGLKITNRYSPGYCNWSVAEQQKLFSLLPNEFCGVSLTDTSLMVPIKSISGIIGIGKNVERRDYLCDTCGVKDCTYRAIRKREETRRKIIK